MVGYLPVTKYCAKCSRRIQVATEKVDLAALPVCNE
jgi:hypothetical protein